MDIREQLQRIYNSVNFRTIEIDVRTAEEITVEYVCIIIHAIANECCTLELDDDILQYFDYSFKSVIVKKKFDNLSIIVMLYIIGLGKKVRTSNQDMMARYGNKPITYSNPDFVELCQHFGIQNNFMTNNIINILKIDNIQCVENAKNNIKSYLGLLNNTKSARNV